MENLIIINASPRAFKSNTLKYINHFKNYFKNNIIEYNLLTDDYNEICKKILKINNILIAYPLYVDGIPAILIEFLKTLEQYKIKKNIKINIIVNCGFLEPEQNFVSVKMIELFCKQNNFILKSCLCIGCGEAIMKTPFSFLVKNKLKKLAKAIKKNENKFFIITIPLTKKLYIKASTKYWINYGKKYGITKKEMQQMEIK